MKSGSMEQQAIAVELAATGAQELLAATSAHLAYSAGDGSPRVVPVGVFWTGTEFVVSTAVTAPKVAALQARPDVALSIEGGSTPEQARALSVRGRASIEIVDGLVPEYVAAARRSMGAEAAAEFEKSCREMYDQMARIAIVPTWVRFYDFGTGRMPTFLKDLAERNQS
jgi:nitroimidazol reductase NimA-like FMN-containing flavoprotein (pyridoxamine 5'-phosphate oxidase superfamily)